MKAIHYYMSTIYRRRILRGLTPVFLCPQLVELKQWTHNPLVFASRRSTCSSSLLEIKDSPLWLLAIYTVGFALSQSFLFQEWMLHDCLWNQLKWFWCRSLSCGNSHSLDWITSDASSITVILNSCIQTILFSPFLFFIFKTMCCKSAFYFCPAHDTFFCFYNILAILVNFQFIHNVH